MFSISIILLDMNRITLNSFRRLVTYSQTKPIHEANKCVLFMNGTLAKPEVKLVLSQGISRNLVFSVVLLEP